MAYKPPASRELPDREAVLAACADIHQTYQRSGFGPAMAKFIALVSCQGPLSAGYADRPAPDPAPFGLPPEDDSSRDDPLAGLATSLSGDPAAGSARALRQGSMSIPLSAGCSTLRRAL